MNFISTKAEQIKWGFLDMNQLKCLQTSTFTHMKYQSLSTIMD